MNKILVQFAFAALFSFTAAEDYAWCFGKVLASEVELNR